MKKLLTGIAMAVFVIYPCISFASYVIHLKDGREFATEQYSEEGDQIKFKKYGGVIGIQKDLVREIEVIEDVEELPEEKEKAEPVRETVIEKKKKRMDVKEVEEGKEDVPEKVAKEQEKPVEVSEEEKGQSERHIAKESDKKRPVIDVERYKKQKKELMASYRDAKKRLNDAILRNDKRARWEAKKEIKKIHSKLAKLIRELKLANDGILPDWWHEATKPQKPDN